MTKENTPYRSPNFTHKEVEALIYNLELKPELIKPAARLTRDGTKRTAGVLTINDKLKIWEQVAAEINKIGESNLTGIVRSADDVKRKWNDLKSRVKNKADDIRNGKLSDKTPLSHLEERVLYLIAKTSHLQGLNGALPPAYLNVIGRKKKDKTACSSSKPVQSEDELDVAESNTDIEGNTEADDIITIKQEIPEILNPHPTMPAVRRIPIITFTAPFSQVLQTPTKARIISNLGHVDSNSRKNTKSVSNDSKQNSESVSNDLKQNNESVCNDSKLNDSREVIEMIYSSQKELKNELKTIKKIMNRIYEQKKKRIAQENEKIQLKKMKLMLKCQKQGVDYEEFITEFM